MKEEKAFAEKVKALSEGDKQFILGYMAGVTKASANEQAEKKDPPKDK
jgi:hypothetical protein